MFRVPSSTPPSTPGRDSRRASRNVPSTTPAGPPPDQSFYPSSTPAGAPPTMNSLFGRSQPTFDRPNSYNFGGSGLFGSSPPKHGVLEGIGSGSIGTSNQGRPAAQRGRTTSSQGYGLPSSSPRSSDYEDEDAEGEEDEDMEEEEEDEDMDEDDYEDEDEEEEDLSAQRRVKQSNRFSQSVVSRASTDDLEVGPALVKAGTKQTQFDLLALAKGLTPSIDRAAIQEPDAVILETERLLEKVHESLHSDAPERRGDVIGQVAQDLIMSWQNASKSKANLSASRSGGPLALAHANRLAALLLNLHHPPPIGHKQPNSALSLVPSRSDAQQYTPIPKVLLDWLNGVYADISEVGEVLKQQGGFSRHPSFWEAVSSTVVRGKFQQTIQLLQGARLEVAATAQDDGLGVNGYSGAPLQYGNEAIKLAVNLIRECPTVVSEDWDIKGHDWNIFRQRVLQAYTNLQDFAEGDSSTRQAAARPFTASNFGISQTQASFQLSVASRRAESRVPWSVYENLRRMYQLLLGNEEEIFSVAGDWIEAALGFTIWWSGEEDDLGQGSLAASRRSIARSQRVRSVDVTPAKAYQERMVSSLAYIVEHAEDDFGINTTDRFEVGLACLIDDNIEAALQIIGSWSLTVASAIAEVASAGEWFTQRKGIMDQFDQSDLMVLSYSEQPKTGLTKDDFLIAYANLLASKETFRDQDGTVPREGWELAVQVLGRLDDSISGSNRIENILNELPLDSSDRVDKITRICHDLGFSQHAQVIALKYADHLRSNTQNYGDTLLYYARSHNAPKLQEVLRVLVAHCLVKSIAYPPPSELDDALNSLITSPKQTLTQLASTDPEAASILSNHLSGYATIRKFYDLRDEELHLKAGQKPTHRSMARKRAAANALMVIIASAASSIRGGLYDPETETAVQVDVLLPLLGEALVFVNQPKRTLTLRHLYDLLAAIEDLDTAPSMIRTQCEEVLSTTLSAAHDSPTSSRQLHKSTSNLTTASSQYSLIGSADFGSADAASTESSAVLVKGGRVDEKKRGWDWRKGFGSGASAEDVVRVLRLSVAKEIVRAFAEGDVVA